MAIFAVVYILNLAIYPINVFMNSRLQTLLISAATGVGASALTLGIYGAAHTGQSAPVQDCFVAQRPANVTPVSMGPDTATDFTTAAESTIEGVVSIKSYARNSRYRGNRDSERLFEYFFGTPSPRRNPEPDTREDTQTGLGSGVIISADGYIVTNNHVINGADRLEVTLHDNKTFDATVIGHDESTDLALLKVDAGDLELRVIPFGDSDALRVGEWVLAVGNPFGFTSTVTTGIVSAKGRSISGTASMGARRIGIESYIQTDAAVNPGNSGGALVNLNGELIGINTAIYSQTGNYAGYSFAIPVSIVSKVVTDIKQYGEVQRAVLGISFGELTPQMARQHGITLVNDGIYVGEVIAGGAADRAGLQVGDVIVEINGNPTHNAGQLQEQMSRLRPGDTVEVGYIRDNKRCSASVTLRNSLGTTQLAGATPLKALGCKLVPVTSETRRLLGLTSGVQVAELNDGPFKEAGIAKGFIITAINKSRVNSVADVETIYRAIVSSNDDDRVMFIYGVYPNGKKSYYAVPLPDTAE